MAQAPKPEPKDGERLQVVLARFGIASRRGVVTLIEDGKVEVNGKVVLEKGFRVAATKDTLRVDGEDLSTGPLKKVYYAFNKPKGVMTTLQDPHAESTVADFFKDVSERVFPVGRLDRDTTGLLILTNDGELAFRLTHPKFGVPKRYHALVTGSVTDAEIKQLEAGVELEEGMTAPCKIQIERKDRRHTELFVILHEGKKRQIRRIFELVGHRVVELERVNYGPLDLGDLDSGEKRPLSPKEVRGLYDATGAKSGKSDGR